MGIRIALDTQISEALAWKLEGLGLRVIRAVHNETDKAFFSRAERFGAELYVSPDYDWMNFALDRGHAFLHLQQGWDMRRAQKEILKLTKGIQK